MSEQKPRYLWQMTKAEQKEAIEEEIYRILSLRAALTDHQKFYLQNAIFSAYLGQFGLSANHLRNVSLPETDWVPAARVVPEMVSGITRETLQRALEALENAQVQDPAVF